MKKLISKKFIQKKKIANIALIALVLSGTNVVFAQSEEDLQTFSLDPIIVTAQRRETTDLETPASVTVLTQEELKQTSAPNLFEALRMQNGISSMSYGAAGASWGAMNSKIIIRGNERGTLILIDGVQSSLNDNYFLETLPIDAIERVEIVKGASSTLYGNNSAGGVINVITKKNMKNSISYTRGEYGKNKESISLNLDRFSILGTFQQSDLKKGLSSNGAAFNDRDMSSVLWKYKITDDLTLTHQHTHTNYQNSRFTVTGNDVDWNKPFEGGRYIYKEDYVRLQYTPDTWKINLFYNRSDRDKITTNSTTNALKTSEKVLLDEFGMDLQKEIKTTFADVIVGANISKEDYKLTNRLDPTKNYDASRRTYALFMQATKEFDDKWTGIFGFRQEWVQSTNRNTLDSFCPQFQVLHKLNDNNSLFVNVSKTFRMPNFTALYGGASGIFASNPALQPEEGWSYEFGWKKASKSSMLKASVYYLDMESITYKSLPGGEIQPVNNPFRNLGLEITYEKNLSDKYSASVGTNFSNPKIKNDSNAWEPRFSRQQYTASVKYKDADWSLALSGSYTADRVGWKDMLPLNFYAGYTLNKNSKLEFNVENILNRSDLLGSWTSSSSTRYYAMPRNISLTYTVFF